VLFSPARRREFAKSYAGPVEARTHGAHRDAEGVGDLVVAEALPHVQHERVAFGFGQRRDRIGDSRPEISGIDPAAHVVGKVERRQTVRRESRDRVEAARLRASMLRQQVGGDAVQPRPRRRPLEVVGRAFLERDAKDVAHHALGFVWTHVADEIPVQHRRVTVEDRAELRRRLERCRDHDGIRVVPHTSIFPAAA